MGVNASNLTTYAHLTCAIVMFPFGKIFGTSRELPTECSRTGRFQREPRDRGASPASSSSFWSSASALQATLVEWRTPSVSMIPRSTRCRSRASASSPLFPRAQYGLSGVVLLVADPAQTRHGDQGGREVVQEAGGEWQLLPGQGGRWEALWGFLGRWRGFLEAVARLMSLVNGLVLVQISWERAMEREVPLTGRGDVRVRSASAGALLLSLVVREVEVAVAFGAGLRHVGGSSDGTGPGSGRRHPGCG